MRRAEVAISAGPPDEVVSDFVDARVSPTGSLENLSQHEVDRLLERHGGRACRQKTAPTSLLLPLTRGRVLHASAADHHSRDRR